MALDIRDKGTATLSPTQVAAVTSTKEGQPYVDVSVSDTRTFLSASTTLTVGVRTNARDVEGDIGIEWTRLTNTTARFYATRGIPAGKEIVFDWISIQD